MLAVVFMEFGGPEVLSVKELTQPVPGPGEVVVWVAASTVNPTDLMMRSGQQASLMVGLVPPYIAGMEFSGHIHSVGEGVASLAPGRPVMGVVNPRRPAGGAHAQYDCVPAASVVPLDPSVDLMEAATVPMNGLTSLAALDALGLQRGSSLLVTGGAGVLAGYVIQLAKAEGLIVIADANEDAAERLRGLGVDNVVPRGDTMDAAVRRIFPRGVDGLIDTALLRDRVAALVRDGGATAALRRTHLISDPRLRNSYISVIDQMTNTAALQRLTQLWATGVFAPPVGRPIPMAEAGHAHRLAEQRGLSGRVVLDFCD